jgi:hypothetical protein
MKLSNSVHFPEDPLTMISRQPTLLEMSVLEDFECHARQCRDCQTARHLTSFIPPDLCPRGFNYARDLTRLFYSASDGNIYSTTATTTRRFRVEIPLHYHEVRKLYRTEQQRGGARAARRPRRSCIDQRSPTTALPFRARRNRTSER